MGSLVKSSLVATQATLGIFLICKLVPPLSIGILYHNLFYSILPKVRMILNMVSTPMFSRSLFGTINNNNN